MKAIIQEGLDDYLYDLYYSQCPPGLRAGNEGFEGYPAHSGESEFTDRPWFLVSETGEGASSREVQPSYDMVRNPGNSEENVELSSLAFSARADDSHSRSLSKGGDMVQDSQSVGGVRTESLLCTCIWLASCLIWQVTQ